LNEQGRQNSNLQPPVFETLVGVLARTAEYYCGLMSRQLEPLASGTARRVPRGFGGPSTHPAVPGVLGR
jgi:hypothetical protein